MYLLFCIVLASHILTPMLLHSRNFSRLRFLFVSFITASLYQSPPLSQHSLSCVFHWTEPSEKLKGVEGSDDTEPLMLYVALHVIFLFINVLTPLWTIPLH